MGQGKYAEALGETRSLTVEGDPAAAEILLVRAEALYGSGNMDRAAKIYEEVRSFSTKLSAWACCCASVNTSMCESIKGTVRAKPVFLQALCAIPCHLSGKASESNTPQNVRVLWSRITRTDRKAASKHSTCALGSLHV